MGLAHERQGQGGERRAMIRDKEAKPPGAHRKCTMYAKGIGVFMILRQALT